MHIILNVSYLNNDFPTLRPYYGQYNSTGTLTYNKSVSTLNDMFANDCASVLSDFPGILPVLADADPAIFCSCRYQPVSNSCLCGLFCSENVTSRVQQLDGAL